MADLLQRRHVHELIEHRDGPCVSIYLPTHRTSPASDQDSIRLKNLLGEAGERLAAGGVRSTDAERLLGPGRALLERDRFWSYQSDGLAVFLAPGWFRLFRLPIEFPELVVVADRFHVKPLIELLAADRRFYVLALSQNEVRLLEGSRQAVEVVDLPDVPHGLREALKYDDLEKEQLLHVTGRGGEGAPAIFHGHGIGGEVDKVLIERYLQQLDEGLCDVTRDERAPLVLAGVGYERAIFRALSHYPNVLEAGIDGSPDRVRTERLHELAWAIVEPQVRRARDEAADRYRAAAGRGAGAASTIEDATRAALDGRVDTLFVAVGEQRWGTVDARTRAITIHHEREPGDEDLLDRVAVETLIRSGTVFAMPPEEVPGSGPVAAVLRY